MSANPEASKPFSALYAYLARATPKEHALLLRFLLGKRTAAMGRANPHLDLFLAEMEVALPGASDVLGDLRFALGNDLHSEIAQWAHGRTANPDPDAQETATLFRRVLARYEALFLR